MKYLVIDTNVYIHYIDIENIKWNDIFQEEICIVIPPKVQREIDKLKDQSNSAKKKRKAKQVSAKIAEYLLENKTGKYRIRSCKDPKSNQFDEDIFNINVDDNWILLSAIRLQEDENIVVTIVSADTNILVKARQIGLDYYRMTDEYKLTEEPTEEEKEIIQLKNDLKRYTTRQSKPDLLFDNHTNLLTCSSPPIIDTNDLVRRKMEEEKQKYPYDTRYETSDYLDGAMKNAMSPLWGYPSASEVAAYNSELNDYFKEYEEFISIESDYENILSRMLKLKFVIVNSGTSPTGDIHLFVKFPTNIILYNKKNIKEKHIDIPIKPASISSGSLRLSRTMQKSIASIQQIKFNTNGAYDTRQLYPYWDLSKKAKYEYHIEKGSLPHNMEISIPLDDLYVDMTESNSFKIEYSIIDSSLIDPICGFLNVKIEP